MSTLRQNGGLIFLLPSFQVRHGFSLPIPKDSDDEFSPAADASQADAADVHQVCADWAEHEDESEEEVWRGTVFLCQFYVVFLDEFIFKILDG